MNLVLFHPSEIDLPLPRQDRRARHLLDVLRRHPGDTFDAGLVNGPRGKGTLVTVAAGHITLAFRWGPPPPPPCPITLLIGLPRPQTARDILREATALGVSSLHFIRTEKGEPSYGNSTLWRNGAWEEYLQQGAAQAFCTHLPAVTHGRTLADALATLPGEAGRLALDNYEASEALSAFIPPDCKSAVLALGAERGWAPAERALLRASGFAFVHLGERVLRTETACIAALTLLKARLGWL